MRIKLLCIHMPFPHPNWRVTICPVCMLVWGSRESFGGFIAEIRDKNWGADFEWAGEL